MSQFLTEETQDNPWEWLLLALESKKVLKASVCYFWNHIFLFQGKIVFYFLHFFCCLFCTLALEGEISSMNFLRSLTFLNCQAVWHNPHRHRAPQICILVFWHWEMESQDYRLPNLIKMGWSIPGGWIHG